MDDICVPIVFVEYIISVPSAKVDLPKFVNRLGIDDFSTPDKLSDLGHAGCLIIQGKTGGTRYYEYGRYDSAAKGVARRKSVPDLKLDRSGGPVWSTLKSVMHAVSQKAGHGGSISAAWIAAPGKFGDMQKYADDRIKQNSVSTRESYGFFTNSCLHLMKGTMEAAGIDTPILVNPSPVSYIAEIRDDFPQLDYNPRTKVLKLDSKPL
ncbi:hypothetical protein EJV46_14860 [Roseococcus sp. SYP-B2431]|uniref:hypothetical protein n=1 Tax=Roseococcus sp. SYP-B2431 TaxID=2496640 RepID=UPI00103874A3|nr:hypothetical protein [Roseococcus sp. SYP-B2431]TCH97413.1 hypothetical protein EJV46_14860 [Roseococcus sp. SYP-B2431]